ncbi:MAG: GNAT family N-acetyltransferase [Lachnospiraceae bacterium]|nr:GNAT family N-acetyltransferase [Ruminococcus sp.]MCM1276399.1 GNAT family N-acetyltransferase [Lachnospiraceae bacterium]
MTKHCIREMTERDLGEVCALYVAAWKEGYKGLLPRSFLDELSPKRWEGGRLLGDGSYVILDGEKIAAHCYTRPAAEEKMRGWGEIQTMYALPEYWGRGFAGELFEYAVDRLRERGFDKIYLYVLDGNERAARFYRKHGFMPNGDTLECEVGGAAVTDTRFVKCFEEE